MKEEDKIVKKLKYYKIALIILLVIVVCGVSYAFFKTTAMSSKKNVISIGEFGINITGEKDNISIVDVAPITDTAGVSSKKYVFQVNNGNYKLNYKLLLADSTLTVSEVRMNDSDVKFILTKNDVASDIKLLGNIDNYIKNNVHYRILDIGTIDKKETVNYGLQLWLSSDAGNEAQNTEFSAHIEIESSQYIE